MYSVNEPHLHVLVYYMATWTFLLDHRSLGQVQILLLQICVTKSAKTLQKNEREVTGYLKGNLAMILISVLILSLLLFQEVLERKLEIKLSFKDNCLLRKSN